MKNERRKRSRDAGVNKCMHVYQQLLNQKAHVYKLIFISSRSCGQWCPLSLHAESASLMMLHVDWWCYTSAHKRRLPQLELFSCIFRASGKVMDEFYPTKRMSTYLVAFLVSDFDKISGATATHNISVSCFLWWVMSSHRIAQHIKTGAGVI